MKPKTPRVRPNVHIYIDTSNDYGRSLLRGVFKYTSLHRHWMVHVDWWNLSQKKAEFPDCDGCLVAGASPQELQAIRQSSHHTVNCSTGAMGDDCPAVHLDNTLAGQLAAKHLHACNLKHFAYYPAAKTKDASSMRLRAFEDALKSMGHSCAIAPVQWPEDRQWLLQHHHKAAAEWIATLPKPVGIMVFDDMVGHDLMLCCKNAGFAVPDEVAVIGINNDELLCEGSWPPLSSVHVDYSRIGFRAAQMLDRLLDGEPLPESERDTKVAPLGVVQRASTNLLAVSDPLLADAIRYMREHACDPCNVQDVLRHVPIARRRLEKRMSAELGRTPHQEILRVRIETAIRMLTETDFPLMHIAQKTGFSAIQNFSKAFRTHVGQTPAAYRRLARPR